MNDKPHFRYLHRHGLWYCYVWCSEDEMAHPVCADETLSACWSKYNKLRGLK